jgi:hypothetical protein
MNVFEQKNPQSEYYDLFNKLQLGTNRSIMIGSAGLASQSNTGDIDLMSYILGRKDNKFINKEIKDIINIIQRDDDIYFMEFKIQYDNGDKIKFTADEIDKIEIPTKNFDKILYLKMDLIYYINSVFKEVSINYWFKEEKETVKNLTEDIKELADEGRYYKIIKRLFAIAKQKDDTVKGLIFSKFLNKASGMEYVYLNNLKAIKELLMVYDDGLTKDKVRINLKNIDVSPNLDEIDKLIERYQTKVDNDALKFLKVYDNKYITT